ncbi:hypothetical protein ACVWY5_001443 [Bradyrhizobium sp. USDA 3256]
MQFPEFGKHEMKTGLHLLIGIENNRTRSIVGEAGWQGQPQFAPRRLLAFPLVKAHPKLMQLRLAHDAGQAQQQAVVVGARIVKPLAIRNDHTKYRAQLEKLMPVPVIAGQARSVETHHKTGVAKADLGNELLETMTIRAASTGLAEILVNHLNALGRPAQTDGTIDKAVLQLRALLVLAHLVHG